MHLKIPLCILRFPYVFIEILGIAFKSIAMDTDLIIDIVYHRVIGYKYRPLNDIRRALYTYFIGI
mgnify:FL=1